MPDQRHYSEPFVCQENLLISESTMCLRRGSASLVEMLQCRTHSVTKTAAPSSCLCPLQDLASTNGTESPRLCSNSAQNQSSLPPFLPPHQHSHHDSASHFDSPHLPLNLQPPSEHRLSAPRSPQPRHHCKACMSLILKDRTKGGGSLGHTHKRTFVTSTRFPPVSKATSPTSPHSSRSPPSTLAPLLASPPTPSKNKPPTPVTSPSRRSPPSQAGLPRSLYEGGDLSLLNYCLHHIVGRRTSSPTLSDRGGASHPMNSHGDAGGISSSVAEHMYKSQSLDVPLCCTPNLDRNLLLSSHYNEARQDPLVG